MKFSTRSSAPKSGSKTGDSSATITRASGPLCADRRTSGVLRNAKPGAIVVIDHLDLDRRTADALLERGVVAVVNAGPFISGRYPNLGPEVLVRSGVVLLDSVGYDVFAAARDGAHARIDQGTLYVGDQALATGRSLDLATVQQQMDAAKAGLATQLESFTHSTTEYLRREQELLLHGRGIPEVATTIEGRPVLVVVREFDHFDDLRRLRRFIREQHPVLIGVDAGADALRAIRKRPDIVVIGEAGLAKGTAGTGERAVTDEVLKSAREVVLHADRSDRVTGAERLDRLGVRPLRVATSGSSEDLALLMADIKGASLIVTVGTHATLDEFLDRDRSGLASTFLTRLRVGPRLVDAKAVPVLYAGKVRLWHLAVVLLAGTIALAAAISTTPSGAEWGDSLQEAAQALVDRIQGLFS